MRWIKKIWHRWGHGVHSPFSYRFIKEVIGESYAYYDYAFLPDKLDRMLYRIAVFMQPNEIISLGGADISAPLMVTTKCTNGKPPRWACMDCAAMAVASPSASAEDIAAAVSNKSMVVILGEVSNRLRSIMPYIKTGVIFTNYNDIAIIAPSSQSPSQTIEVKLP